MWISNAFAQAPAAGADSGGLMSFLPLVLMFAVLYFIMIRPQMKRQKETKAMLESLSVGDEVVTVGGIIGKVTALKDDHDQMYERINRLSMKLDDIEKKVDDNHRTVCLINKLVYAALIAAVGAYVAQFLT